MNRHRTSDKGICTGAVLAAAWLIIGGLASPLPVVAQDEADASAQQDETVTGSVIVEDSITGTDANATVEDGGAGVVESESDAAADDNGRRGERDMDVFEGYDFGQVVERVESSVDPLQREMDAGFRAFTEDVQRATDLLEQGRASEALTLSRAAIEDLLEIRDEVVSPMWEGQLYLTEQIGEVRDRLARAVAVEAEEDTELDDRTEARLDSLARRIDAETDVLRRERLVAHYRTVRNLGEIRHLAEQMSPDQRRLWGQVLLVLNEAATAHQQVLMGSEVLFARLETTSANLEEYIELMNTVEGASKLLIHVHGLDGHTSGLAEFAENMQKLTEGLGGFTSTVQHALETRMYELEGQIEAIQPYDNMGFDDTGLVSTRADSELDERIERIRTDADED